MGNNHNRPNYHNRSAAVSRNSTSYSASNLYQLGGNKWQRLKMLVRGFVVLASILSLPIQPAESVRLLLY
jgi:hypothetical protein